MNLKFVLAVFIVPAQNEKQFGKWCDHHFKTSYVTGNFENVREQILPNDKVCLVYKPNIPVDAALELLADRLHEERNNICCDDYTLTMLTTERFDVDGILLNINSMKIELRNPNHVC